MPSAASAATYSVNFCAEYNVDYEDVDIGEDFWTNNSSNKTARGIRVRVRRNSDDDDRYYDYTDYNGSSAGCTGNITLDDDETYLIRVYSQALLDENYVVVRNNPTNNSRFAYTWDSAYRPSAGTTETIVTPNYAQWRIAAAAGYSQYRRRAGLNGKTYILYDEAYQGQTGVPAIHNRIYIGPTATDRKFVIVHEMGHSLARFKNGGAQPVTNYASSEGDCESEGDWGMNSKEYQSAAATEGFAEFYAAVIWNNDSQTNCWFYSANETDWDLDGEEDGNVLNCEFGPVDGISPPITLSPTVDGTDYLGDMCDGSLDNRATAYDWLRFWWDYTTNYDTYFTDCAVIWNLADPNTWTGGANCVGLTCPYDRLYGAALVHSGSSGSDFEDCAELNGTERD